MSWPRKISTAIKKQTTIYDMTFQASVLLKTCCIFHQYWFSQINVFAIFIHFYLFYLLF